MLQNATLPNVRTYEGQRLNKMAKLLLSSDDKNKQSKLSADNVWNKLITDMNKNFPSLGSRKTAMKDNDGKYVKVMMEDESIDINKINPVLIGKIFEQYLVGHTDQKRTRNAIMLKTKDERQFNSIMTLKEKVKIQLKDQTQNIKFEEVKLMNERKGVITEESWNDLSEEEIKNEINQQFMKDITNTKTGKKEIVKAVKRITRKTANGDILNTKTCILTFNSTELPETVKMCGQTYSVRIFMPRPRICWRCLKLGHTTVSCRATNEYCKECGNAKDSNHVCGPSQCPNCPQDDRSHKPNSGECPAMDVEKLIIDHQVRFNVSYFDAKREIRNLICKDTQQRQNQTPTRDSPQETSAQNTQKTDAIDTEICTLTTEIEQKKKKLAEVRKLREELEQLNAELQKECEAIENLKQANYRLQTNLQEKTELMEIDETTRKRLREETDGTSETKRQAKKYSVGTLLEEGIPNGEQVLNIDRISSQLETKEKLKYAKIIREAKEKEYALVWYEENEQINAAIAAKPNPEL